MRDEDVRGGCAERWKLRNMSEKGWEMRDEDGGAMLRDGDWETWARKVESEDGGGGCVEMKIMKHGWRLGFRK